MPGGSNDSNPSGFCWKACAIKKMAYATTSQQCCTNAELAGLKAAQGLPYLMQGLAAFDYTSPETGTRELYIISE